MCLAHTASIVSRVCTITLYLDWPAQIIRQLFSSWLLGSIINTYAYAQQCKISWLACRTLVLAPAPPRYHIIHIVARVYTQAGAQPEGTGYTGYTGTHGQC